jgi:hypothetical protein
MQRTKKNISHATLGMRAIGSLALLCYIQWRSTLYRVQEARTMC